MAIFVAQNLRYFRANFFFVIFCARNAMSFARFCAIFLAQFAQNRFFLPQFAQNRGAWDAFPNLYMIQTPQLFYEIAKLRKTRYAE